MDEMSSSIEKLQIKNKHEAILKIINDLEEHALLHGLIIDLQTPKDEEDKEYEEDKDFKVLEMYEEGEDVPVLKPFLGKTTDYGNLQKLLTGKTPLEQSTALRNLIKSYNPSSDENNKALLSQLFTNLLQYVNDLFSNLKDERETSKSLFIMESLTPQFYNIAQIDKVSSRKSFAELLTEKYKEYQKNTQQIPDLDTLIIFKLLSPFTEFPNYLGMSKPSFHFMLEILKTCKFLNARSISRGLFVSALMLEYTALGKGYVPAGINFLRGVLFLSVKTVSNRIEPAPPLNFRNDAKILILEDDCSKLDFGMRISPKDLFTDSIDNGFKIRTLLSTLSLLEEFFHNCDEYEQAFVFEAHLKLLKSLKSELYPKKVSNAIQKTIKYIAGEPDV